MEKKKVNKKSVKKVVKTPVKKKKNNKKTKGFTLIEILAVIGLIGVILIIAIPAMNSISKSAKQRQLEAKKSVLVSAAEVYAKNNSSKFIKTFGDTYMIHVPVRTLVYYGYVSADDVVGEACKDQIGCVIDPVTDSSLNNQIITIKRVKSIIQATWGEEEIVVQPEMQVFRATFIDNGASPSGCDLSTLDVNRRCGYCTGYTSCSAVVPTIYREDYEIEGWGTSANATTADASLVEGGEIFLDESNNNKLTYYAVTHKDVVITFDPNEGTIRNGSSSQAYCSIYNTNSSCAIAQANIPELDAPDAASTRKSGWYSAASGGTEVSLNNVSNSQTVYAQWSRETYVVTLNPNGGSYTSTPSGYTLSGSNYTRDYDLTTPTFALPEPGKGGNIFAGWTGSNGTTAQKNLSIENGSTGNRTYTANWDECPAGTYAAAGASSCTSCPSSHPYSAPGSTSIGACYRLDTTVASNYSYTNCIYSSESAALAACGSDKTSCTAVSCSKIYYILNYDVYAQYGSKNKESTIDNCTTVTRKSGGDSSNHYGNEALISENGDSRCDYFSDFNTTGISLSTADAFCKGSSYDKSSLRGNCSLPSNDYCNQILINIMLHTGSDNLGDCYSKCQGPTTFDGGTNTAYYPVENVRTDSNQASGKQFFIKQDNSGDGFIHRVSCSGTYYTCASATQSDSKGYMYKNIKIKNCKITKAAYNDGSSSTYRLQYKAVTQSTTPIYYNN